MTGPCPAWCDASHDPDVVALMGVVEHRSAAVVLPTSNGRISVEVIRVDPDDTRVSGEPDIFTGQTTPEVGPVRLYLSVNDEGDDLALTGAARLAEVLLSAIEVATGGRAKLRKNLAEFPHTTTARVLHRRHR